jgi:hypothetical protein
LRLVKVFGVANRWDGGAEVSGDFVADVLGTVAVFFYVLAYREAWVLEAVVGDGICAESGELFPFVELRSTGRANAPVPTPTLRGRLPLELCLSLVFLFPM